MSKKDILSLISVIKKSGSQIQVEVSCEYWNFSINDEIRPELKTLPNFRCNIKRYNATFDLKTIEVINGAPDQAEVVDESEISASASTSMPATTGGLKEKVVLWYNSITTYLFSTKESPYTLIRDKKVLKNLCHSKL